MKKIISSLAAGLTRRQLSLLKAVFLLVFGASVFFATAAYADRFIRYQEAAGTAPSFFSIDDNLSVTGKVGIGTSAPAAPLEVRGTIRSAASGSRPSLDLVDLDNSYVWGVAADAAGWAVRDRNAGVSRLFVASSGSVGIGTESPRSALHLYGSGLGNRAQIRLQDTDQGGSVGYIQSSNGYLGFGAGGEGQMVIKAGKVGVGTPEPAAALDVKGDILASGGISSSAGDVTAFGDVRGQRFCAGTDCRTLRDMGPWATGGADISYSGGKVGIGTASPAASLDVVGSGKFSDLATSGNVTAAKFCVGTDCRDWDGFGGKNWQDSATEGDIYYNAGNVGVGTNSPSAALEVVGGAKADSLAVSGNVGIGTDTPAYKLDVAGTIRSQNSGAPGGQNVIVGNNAFLSDIGIANTLGIYGFQNPGQASVKLGSSGPVLSGNGGSLSVTGNEIISGNLSVSGNANVSGTLNTGCQIIICSGGDWITCDCPAGKYIQAGGCHAGGSPFVFQTSWPISLNTWQCGGHGGWKQISMICCRQN